MTRFLFNEALFSRLGLGLPLRPPLPFYGKLPSPMRTVVLFREGPDAQPSRRQRLVLFPKNRRCGGGPQGPIQKPICGVAWGGGGGGFGRSGGRAGVGWGGGGKTFTMAWGNKNWLVKQNTFDWWVFSKRPQVGVPQFGKPSTLMGCWGVVFFLFGGVYFSPSTALPFDLTKLFFFFFWCVFVFCAQHNKKNLWWGHSSAPLSCFPPHPHTVGGGLLLRPTSFFRSLAIDTATSAQTAFRRNGFRFGPRDFLCR